VLRPESLFANLRHHLN